MPSLIYRVYESRLLRQVERLPKPRHVGIILDGNRRFGRQHQVNDPRALYLLGAHKLDAILEWCGELQIPAITLWVFSPENLQRPAEEVSGILGAIETKLKLLARDPHLHRHRVRVRAIGRLEMLPPSTIAVLRAAEAATEAYDGIVLTIAAAYGGREEITDAVRALLEDSARKGHGIADVIAQLSPDAIGRHLYSPDLPDPDLIIRTSGEIRLSGFLLWQSAFSEFYFSDVYWPAFRKIDFLRAVRSFQQRSRRFGR